MKKHNGHHQSEDMESKWKGVNTVLTSKVYVHILRESMITILLFEGLKPT